MKQVVHLIFLPNQTWKVINPELFTDRKVADFKTIEEASVMLAQCNIPDDEIDEALIRIYTTEGKHKYLISEFIEGKFSELKIGPSLEEKVH